MPQRFKTSSRVTHTTRILLSQATATIDNTLRNMAEKHFYIASRLNQQMVVTPRGFSKNPNTELVIENKLPKGDRNAETQHWILDEENMIRSFYKNGRTHFAPTDSGKGNPLQAQEWLGTSASTFQLLNGEIKCQTGHVMDVKGSDRNPGTPVIAWPHHGGTNQQWDIVYC